MNNFLPPDYKLPASGGAYMKLEQGENRIRVLGSPILGWLIWNELPDGKKSANRIKMAERRPADSKHFWAFPVWNYGTKTVQILELTQSGIQGDIKTFAENKKWGNPRDYDIVISREGQGMDTKYSVLPEPKETLPKEITDIVANTAINLEALYVNGDPFAPVSEDLPFDSI